MDIRSSEKSLLFSKPYRSVHTPPPRRCSGAGGVVFYANYLKFFERARTEWLRHLGVGQQALREATGAIFVVSDTSLRYRAPPKLDDLLRITVLPTEIGRVSMTLQQQAWRQDGEESTLLCEGSIRIGCVDALSLRPRRFPPAIVEALSA